MEEKFIKRYHKKYIGNNSEEINKKYFYEFKYNNNIFYIYKKQYNKYNDLIINPLEFKYMKKNKNKDKDKIYYYIDNNELYIDNDFLYEFTKNISNNLISKYQIILQCNKIIINFNNYHIINKFFNLNLEGHTIIFKNGNLYNIKYYNFICNNKYGAYINYCECNNIIINKELINFHEIHIKNQININSSSLYKSTIETLYYYNKDLNNLKTLDNLYRINYLYLKNTQNLIDFNNKISVDNNIILQSNINNLIITNKINIIFNNYKINNLCIKLIENINNINEFIKKILMNNSVNELTIRPVKKSLENITLDFQNMKLNKLNIYKNINIININKVNKISFFK